jgi:hypothetical protein
MKLEKTANYLESQTDNSNMKKAQRQAGKRARMTLHTEKLISNTMYLKMMTNHMQCNYRYFT